MEQHRGTSSAWMARAAILDTLDVSPRTLTNRCQAGKVERRKVGRRSLYRILDAGTEATEATQPRQRGNTGATGARNAGNLALAPDALPGPDPSPEISDLVHLVNQLTEDLVRSERDRGEAMGIGHAIADERDRLRAELDALRVELLELAGTSRAWPLRRRLLAVIMPVQLIQ